MGSEKRKKKAYESQTHYWYKQLRNYTTTVIRQEKKAYLNYKIERYGINAVWQ